MIINAKEIAPNIIGKKNAISPVIPLPLKSSIPNKENINIKNQPIQYPMIAPSNEKPIAKMYL